MRILNTQELAPQFENVAPTRFALTNRQSPWLDGAPGLTYYVNADTLPIQDHMIEALKLMCRNIRLGGWRTEEIIGSHVSQYVEKWRTPLPVGTRDNLYCAGYNYVGHIMAGRGPVVWGQNVTLKSGKQIDLFDALVLIYCVKLFDHSLDDLRKQGVFGDLHIPLIGYPVEAMRYILSDLAAQRFTYTPDSGDGRAVEQLGDNSMVAHFKLIRTVAEPASIHMTLHGHGAAKVPIVHGQNAAAPLKELIELLYLPGTLSFKCIAIA